MGDVTFNGWTITDSYIVSAVERGLPVAAVSTMEIAGRDGAVVNGSQLKPLTVKMTLVLPGASGLSQMRTAARDIASRLAVSEPKALSFSDDGGRYYLAVPSGTVTPRQHLDGVEFPVSFLVPDPAMYGDEAEVAVASDAPTQFAVAGSYRTSPIIEAQGVIVDPSSGVWGARLDGADRLHIQLPDGGPHGIVIDCGRRTVLLDGYACLPTLDSDWWEMAPGSHTAAVDNGTGGFTITYVERWL